MSVKALLRAKDARIADLEASVKLKTEMLRAEVGLTEGWKARAEVAEARLAEAERWVRILYERWQRGCRGEDVGPVPWGRIGAFLEAAKGGK